VTGALALSRSLALLAAPWPCAGHLAGPAPDRATRRAGRGERTGWAWATPGRSAAYGVAELDKVAEGLDSSARRITDLLSAKRDFAAERVHQLRPR